MCWVTIFSVYVLWTGRVVEDGSGEVEICWQDKSLSDGYDTQLFIGRSGERLGETRPDQVRSGQVTTYPPVLVLMALAPWCFASRWTDDAMALDDERRGPALGRIEAATLSSTYCRANGDAIVAFVTWLSTTRLS